MMAASSQIFSLNTWKNWEKTGKTEVLEKVQSLIDEDGEGAAISMPNKMEDLTLALHEVISAVLKGHLRKDYAKAVLTEMFSLHPEIGSQIVEIIAVLELEVTSGDKASKQRGPLLGLIKILDLEKLFKERLEIDTLGDAEVIKHKKAFLTKQIKVRTKMFYKQQKFNLLREESEGYAKLVTELNQEITARVTPSSIIEVIRGLIGTFNLDPNRVLDLILEAFECRPQEHRFYNSLLKFFPHEASTISEILGFKLNNHRDSGLEAKGIYVVMALLLQAGILTVADIYGWLSPEDSSMLDDCTRELDAARQFANKANVISTKDKDTEKDKEEDDKDKHEFKSNIKYNTNQKMHLAIAMLEVGSFDDFLVLCDRFPEHYLVSRQPISQELCHLIHTCIDPLYKKLFQLPSRLKIAPLKTSKRGFLLLSPASSIEDLSERIFPMISVLGPYIYNDVALMYKILRISKIVLKQVSKTKASCKNSFYYDFLSVLDDSLLPAVSMFESNPCIAEEVWESLKHYPYQHRYKLYGRWKNETYELHPHLIRSRTTLLKKAKYIMMRITKETIKPVSRGIAKQTHNFPGAIFEYILKQVQLYDNLISPVVDSFKYLTSLSYDVLGYCMVEILSLCKDRTQNEAMGVSPWLQSLSVFSGSVCKKYSIELGGMLQFIANQLKSEVSIDLILLKDIVQKMGGTDSMGDLTPDQHDAMCGGEHLRREAGQYLQEKNTKRSSQRLKDGLIENDLAIPLLLLMAQQRSSIIFNQKEASHLKLAGKLYDQCHDTTVQFGSYVFNMLTIDEMTNKLPTIGSLIADYHITADIAFFFARPIFSTAILSKYDELRRKDKSEKKMSSDDKKRIFVEACAEAFEPIIEVIRPQYGAKIWEDMAPSFFLTFWTLTMSDLEVPIRIYDKEIKKLAEPAVKLTRKRDIERQQALKEKLEDEKKRQMEHSERIQYWLEKESETWFQPRTNRSPKNNTVTTFLQLCIFPRCTFSTLDAIFCARFVKMLHSMKTPNFSTLLCYDKMYCDITYTVASCTEQEVNFYAKFLLGTLETVMHWHESRDRFEKECSNYPGFITRYRISMHEANDYVDYENYRHVVHKWHYKITKALVTCLESGNYIQIRNAILLLQGILPCFPAIVNLAPVIEKRIEKVKINEKNHRNDLFVLANSYSGRLKAKKPNLISEDKFHQVKKGEKPSTNVSIGGEDEKGRHSTKEQNGEMNGEVDILHDSKGRTPKKDSKVDDKDDEKDEKRKREKKKDEKEKEKDAKRKKETKRVKGDEDDDDVEGNAQEGSVTSNGSVTDNKMDPPADRGSKRRKTDHDSKTRKEDSKKDKKRRSRSQETDPEKRRSRSQESDPEQSPKDPKKEKKEKKRSSSPSDDGHKSKSRRSQKSS